MAGRITTVLVGGLAALLLAGCADWTPATEAPSTDRGEDAIMSDPMNHPAGAPDGTGQHLMGNLNEFVHEN